MTTTPTSRPAFEVILASEPELIQACYDIRIEVFVVEQGFSIDDEIDEYDKIAVFFLLNVLEENEDGSNKRIPIGTVRIVPGINKLGRLAILKDYRKFGFGRVLVEATHKWAEDELAKDDSLAPKAIKLSSQIYAIPFYEKLGYKAVGEQYDEDGAHDKTNNCLVVGRLS